MKDFRFTGHIFKTPYLRCYYRPLAVFTHLIEYKFYRLDPFGYHLTNTFLHILNAILIFLILKAVFGEGVLCFIAPLLFLVHPVQTEEVTYISGRCGLLAAFFVLLSFFFYVRYLSGNKRVIYYIASLVSFMLGLFAKESAVILPVFLIFYDYFINRDGFPLPAKRTGEPSLLRLSRYVPFFFVLVCYLVFWNSMTGTTTNIPGILPGLFLRLLSMSKAFLIYFSILFFPLDLRNERLLPVITDFNIMHLAPAVILIILVVALIKLSKYSTEVIFGLGWFFIAMLPVSQIFPLTVQGYLFTPEHFMYLPSAGFFTVIAFGLSRASRWRFFSKTSQVALFSALIIFYGLLTVKRNSEWKDPKTFYQLGVRQSPYNARLRTSLGNCFNASGEYDKAIAEFKKALAIKPDYFIARNNLGISYARSGKPDSALAEFNAAQALDPSNPEPYNNAGFVLSEKGLLDEAVFKYRKAIELAPNYASAHNNLGVVYLKKGMLEEAAQEWSTAFKIDPDLHVARQNLEGLKKRFRREK